MPVIEQYEVKYVLLAVSIVPVTNPVVKKELETVVERELVTVTLGWVTGPVETRKLDALVEYEPVAVCELVTISAGFGLLRYA